MSGAASKGLRHHLVDGYASDIFVPAGDLGTSKSVTIADLDMCAERINRGDFPLTLMHRHPMISGNHSDPHITVGMFTKASVDRALSTLHVEARLDSDPRGNEIAAEIAKGALNGFSLGFITDMVKHPDGTISYPRKLIEGSAVRTPEYANAQIIGLREVQAFGSRAQTAAEAAAEADLCARILSMPPIKQTATTTPSGAGNEKRLSMRVAFDPSEAAAAAGGDTAAEKTNPKNGESRNSSNEFEKKQTMSSGQNQNNSGASSLYETASEVEKIIAARNQERAAAYAAQMNQKSMMARMQPSWDDMPIDDGDYDGGEDIYDQQRAHAAAAAQQSLQNQRAQGNAAAAASTWRQKPPARNFLDRNAPPYPSADPRMNATGMTPAAWSVARRQQQQQDAAARVDAANRAQYEAFLQFQANVEARAAAAADRQNTNAALAEQRGGVPQALDASGTAKMYSQADIEQIANQLLAKRKQMATEDGDTRTETEKEAAEANVKQGGNGVEQPRKRVISAKTAAAKKAAAATATPASSGAAAQQSSLEAQVAEMKAQLDRMQGSAQSSDATPVDEDFDPDAALPAKAIEFKTKLEECKELNSRMQQLTKQILQKKQEGDGLEESEAEIDALIAQKTAVEKEYAAKSRALLNETTEDVSNVFTDKNKGTPSMVLGRLIAIGAQSSLPYPSLETAVTLHQAASASSAFSQQTMADVTANFAKIERDLDMHRRREFEHNRVKRANIDREAATQAATSYDAKARLGASMQAAAQTAAVAQAAAQAVAQESLANDLYVQMGLYEPQVAANTYYPAGKFGNYAGFNSRTMLPVGKPFSALSFTEATGLPFVLVDERSSVSDNARNAGSHVPFRQKKRFNKISDCASLHEVRDGEMRTLGGVFRTGCQDWINSISSSDAAPETGRSHLLGFNTHRKVTQAPPSWKKYSEGSTDFFILPTKQISGYESFYAE